MFSLKNLVFEKWIFRTILTPLESGSKNTIGVLTFRLMLTPF